MEVKKIENDQSKGYLSCKIDLRVVSVVQWLSLWALNIWE